MKTLLGLLAAFCVLDLLAVRPAPAAPPGGDGVQVVFFPAVYCHNTLRVVVTDFNNDPYGYFYEAVGYVENLGDEPLLATLVADITVYPFSIETPLPPYTTTVQFKTALTATLPGQRNPFSLEQMCYKECRAVTAVRVARAASLDGGQGNYLPLTIASWLFQDGALSGAARNDSAQALDSARVAAADLGSCAWKEAVLQTRSLSPGQETTFIAQPYSAYCAGEHLVIVGQGHAP